MSEIMPIPPSPPLPVVHKVEREKERNSDKSKQQSKDDTSAGKQPTRNDQPARHIDEIV
ncbi:hypothetical protein IVG45_14780 [Methylomonas sp. LL1]|uniref:hypothetical protein n=1 Tax=Methylomonas sp. LL1 TaxID=2785785 RepID=UPI0018C35F8A|nr:hypothetical protein [Methylomonas sp. LL1]QPK62118.1 hypothetical protein IVG45_14780 [Methylomonas sp. LL1]CAG1020924.1 hypothetical protein MTYM_00635 [Methylococcales bacterium]